MSKSILISWIVYFSFLIFVAVNYVIFHFLNLEPRTWVTSITWILMVLTPFILIFFLLIRLIHICKNTISRGFAVFALIVYIIISLLFLFVLSIKGLFAMETEKLLEDGTILVTEAGFPDPGPSYRCVRVTFFARQPIPNTWENSAGSTIVQEPTEEPSSKIDAPEKAAQTIYDTIFAPQGKKCSFQYNAKGNLYLILDKGSRELDGITVSTQETLTYDRISQNGKCYLFVYYEEHYDSEGNKLDSTSILNFYAVNLTTGQVTAADKTSWSDTASEAYCEATGEY